jgi:hypothetical protein
MHRTYLRLELVLCLSLLGFLIHYSCRRLHTSRKVPISFVMSIRPSVCMYQPASHWTISIRFDI